MSFRSMLKHRCNVLRLHEVSVNGYSSHVYETEYRNVPIKLDLSYLRRGKDPMWTPEAGRPQSRTGVLFALVDSDIRSGDRIVMTKGPAGAFQVEGTVDEVWDAKKAHHLEAGVKEVSSTLTKGEE